MDEEKERVEEVSVDAEEKVKESQEAEENSEEMPSEPIPSTEPALKKMKKHAEAKKLVQEAKNMLEVSEREHQDCKLLLEEDLREYHAAKNSLKEHAWNEAQALLLELGETAVSTEEEEPDVVFEPKEEVEPVMLKDVRSGRFTGALLALIGGIVTFVGLIYWATEKQSMTLDISTLPAKETAVKLFGTFGTLVGQPDSMPYGILVVATIVLMVMGLIYGIRVGLKGNANLQFAAEQMEKTQQYITHKSNCKAQMEKVDAHIKEALKVLKDYEVVLAEQNGKLKRILYFEGRKSNENSYHTNSLQEITQTQSLVDHIGRFINTPMSEEGKISGKSTLFLHSAKERLQKMLEKYLS